MKAIIRSTILFVVTILIGLLSFNANIFAAPLQLTGNIDSMTIRHHKISIPEGASLLTVKVTEGRGDLDIFLKKGRTVTGNSVALLKEDSDVCSISDGWQEIVALNHSSQPVISTGDWYLSIVNLNDDPTLCILSVFIEPQPEVKRRLYFPYIYDAGKWQTEITLINVSDSETITGELLLYDQNGYNLAGTKQLSLAPNSRRKFAVRNDFPDPEKIRYMIFSSVENALQGYAKIIIDGNLRAALPAVYRINSGDLSITHIASTEDWATEISLLNTTSENREVTIKFNTGQSKIRSLKPGAYESFFIYQLFDKISQPQITSATILNASGILGSELFINSSLGIMEGLLLKDETTSEIFFPHITIEDGWSTGIVVYNPDDDSCDLTITPFDMNGASLSPTYKSIAGQQKYIGSVADMGFPANAAWVKVDSSKPVSGFELFLKINQMGGYSGVNISRQSGLLAQVGSPDVTGVAFINPDVIPVSLMLTAYDSDGGLIDTEKLTLSAHEKKVGVVNNFFSEAVEKATHIRFSSDHKVVGFQLNLTTDGEMLDGLEALSTAPGYDIAGDGIIELAAQALEQSDPVRFKSLLDQGSLQMVEAAGEQFEMSSQTGKSAASNLAEALRQARMTEQCSKFINYETEVDGQIYNFHVIFDANVNTWKLGGL